ncbi:MAG: threonine aldolase [Marinoscillum sp.]|jgi:threonine aldolase
MIDLRSDTITKPTTEMLEAMMQAEVGDDVLGDDPTVNQLQSRIAQLFGMEDALFCPSGTMANQIAMNILTAPRDEVICDQYAHVYLYEAGGMAYNSMLTPRLLVGDRGRLTADLIEKNINPIDVHYPRTSLVCLENTMNRGGGSIYKLDEIRKISELCKRKGLKLHLDGARLFNAIVETGDKPSEYGSLFDTISVCFSKGLGAPVGSVLLGSNKSIEAAKRVRKALGGGMRQIGYLAAACLYALDHHVDRLKEDHARARSLGQALKESDLFSEIMPVDTNIVIGKLREMAPETYLKLLEARGTMAIKFGPDAVRFVTHLGFDDDQLNQTVQVIKSLK